MNREERAKQFLPFDALKGLGQELRLREELALRQARRTLSDEEAERLTRRLNALVPGDIVTVHYYDRGQYVQKEGSLLAIDRPRQRLILTFDGKKQEISFYDLYRLKKQ